jgi:uncharacterized protein (TIGR02118 family)
MPDDTDAFDAHYEATHIPLTKEMPHLKGFEVSRGEVTSSDPSVQVYLSAMLSFENKAKMEASMASPQGQAAVDDLANFASGGLSLLTIDTSELL